MSRPWLQDYKSGPARVTTPLINSDSIYHFTLFTLRGTERGHDPFQTHKVPIRVIRFFRPGRDPPAPPQGAPVAGSPPASIDRHCVPNIYFFRKILETISKKRLYRYHFLLTVSNHLQWYQE